MQPSQNALLPVYMTRHKNLLFLFIVTNTRILNSLVFWSELEGLYMHPRQPVDDYIYVRLSCYVK